MLISQLNSPLRELAEKRRAEAKRQHDNALFSAFDWEDTPEGYNYWQHVYLTGEAPHSETEKLNDNE